MEWPAKVNPTHKFSVVCFGSSAGGLTALKEVLENLRIDSGMAFVVVGHRTPENTGLLSECLLRFAKMRVVDIEDGMLLEPNRIFVMPPRTHVLMRAEALYLEPRPLLRGWPVSISSFLFSLAETMGPRAVAVILSGMGHDGCDALKAIKRAGGATFAQRDPDWGSMPNNAVSTGHVDFILSAADIGKHLSMMGRHRSKRIETERARNEAHHPICG